MGIKKMKGSINYNLCEKIIEIIPKNLSDIYSLEEKLEAIGISAKFINNEHIFPYAYYHYLLYNKYVLHLFFKQGILKYLSIYEEIPEKKKICEKDLE
jgi:hypothetical protein